jgi:hypothetical protein
MTAQYTGLVNCGYQSESQFDGGRGLRAVFRIQSGYDKDLRKKVKEVIDSNLASAKLWGAQATVDWIVDKNEEPGLLQHLTLSSPRQGKSGFTIADGFFKGVATLKVVDLRGIRQLETIGNDFLAECGSLEEHFQS